MRVSTSPESSRASCCNAVRTIASCLLLAVALKSQPACSDDPRAVTAGLQSSVTFTQYSALSRSPELVRRLISPLNARRLEEQAARAGTPLRGQTIDLSTEKFAVYVPPGPPRRGYALLVFIPPWSRAQVPTKWISALDRRDVIFVTAANSGNEADVLGRREPLALLAVQNIVARYPIDPQQVYIGGFSGGARVALRVALGYPDVFHGVLLNAGSDPIGTAQIPLPPAELFREFQESTRLVYVTGEHDDGPAAQDKHSRQSMQEWCVFDVITETEPWRGHESADASAFDRSLEALLRQRKRDPNKLAECRARVEADLNAQLQDVENSLSRGDRDSVTRLLLKIDERFGGLAAPRSVELSNR